MLKTDYDAIAAQLTAANAPFEMVNVAICGGAAARGWRQAPASLRAIVEASRERGDAPFIQFGDEQLSFGEHYRQVAQCAQALQDRYGVGKGDRVAIAMRNLPEWSVAFWAVVALGAVAVSINAWMTGPEMTYCIADSGARVLIADDERIARLADHMSDLPLEAIIAVRSAEAHAVETLTWDALLATAAAAETLPPADIAPGDDATILYTSGTTGNPKGALGPHRASCHNVVSTCYFSAVDRQSRGLPPANGDAPCFLLTIPLFHGAGCQNGLIYSLYNGGRLILMTRWDAQEALTRIAAERVTDLVATPSQFVQLAELVERDPAGADVSSVQSALVGGASPPADLPARLSALMPQAAIGTGYGQTECTQIATLSSGSDYAEYPLSCGRGIPICDLRIVDDQDRDVAPGETGELLIRSATLVNGYINRPEETEATFAQGWLRTGDLVHLDGEGRLYIDDRKKDMVIRGGENIYCIEVEQALYAHGDVIEAAVFGMPHPVLGEEPVAMVLLQARSEVDEAALRAHVGQRIARFKVPTAIHLADAPLPRNANGKIMKREIRAALLSAAAQA